MINIILIALFFCVFNVVSVQFISNNIVLVLDVVLWLAFNYLLHRAEMNRKTVISKEPIVSRKAESKMLLKKENQMASSEI